MMEGLLVRLLCMLLTCTAAFSGYIQEDVAYIPEDATYMQKDIAYIQEDGSTIVEAADPASITLEKFVLDTDIQTVDVCASSEISMIKPGNASLIYRIQPDNDDTPIDHDAEGEVTDDNCATIQLNTSLLINGKRIHYGLTIIDSADETNIQFGYASFTIKDNDYNAENVEFVSCGDRMYTRETEVNPINCNQPSVKVNGKICYTYVVNGTAGFPDSDRCLNLPDESQGDDAEIQVCLPLSAPTNIKGNTKYNVKVNSLTYIGDDTDTKLDLSYKKSSVAFTDTTEIIIQSTADKFTVAVCGSNETNCKPEGFSRGSTEYEVCAVVSDGKDAGASAVPGLITDINVITYVDTGIEMLKFGFDNQNDDKFYYYATVADTNDENTQNVGIDCSGIDPTSTCYVFIDVADIETDRVFTVQYSVVGTGPADPPNTIILNIPKPEPSV